MLITITFFGNFFKEKIYLEKIALGHNFKTIGQSLWLPKKTKMWLTAKGTHKKLGNSTLGSDPSPPHLYGQKCVEKCKNMVPFQSVEMTQCSVAPPNSVRIFHFFHGFKQIQLNQVLALIW